MGSCFSEPLKRVQTEQNATPQPKNDTKKESSERVTTSPPKPKEKSAPKSNEIEIQIMNMPESPNVRPYFSFTSFICQNPLPQIYEWVFEDKIQEGSISHVYKVRNSETKEIAVAKVYNCTTLCHPGDDSFKQPFSYFQREVDIVFSLHHSNILPILEFIEDNPTNSLILIMPFVEFGNLAEFLEAKKASDDVNSVFDYIIICFYQMLDVLNYLHTMGIAHRNIMPDSIFVFNDHNYALSHFRLIEKVQEKGSEVTLLTQVKGNPLIYSPEMCSGNPYDGRLADNWALGMTFYYAFFGEFPFTISEKIVINVSIMTKNLRRHSLTFPDFAFQCPDSGQQQEVKRLLSGLLEKDPSKRMHLEECLASDLFKGIPKSSV